MESAAYTNPGETQHVAILARVVRTWIAIGSVALVVGIGTLILARGDVAPTADPPIGYLKVADGATPTPPSNGDTLPGRVLNVIVVDAETDVDVGLLSDGAIVARGDLPDMIAIRADTSPPEVGSVTFQLDDERTIEDTAPYAVAGDVTGERDYLPLTLEPGPHVLTATPWNEAGGQGIPGEGVEVSFQVTEGSSRGREATAFDDLAPWIIVTALVIALLSAVTALRTAGRIRSAIGDVAT